MNHRTFDRLSRICCVACCAALLGSNAQAQFEAEPAATALNEPSLNNMSANELSLTEASLRGPAVASILASARDTPADQLNAVFLLLDLGETDIARSIWQKFATDELDEPAEAALVREFGAARFLTLARRAQTDGLDGGREFAETCLRSAAKLGRDPQQLAKLIDTLNDPAAEVRRAARSDLSVTGNAGAIACLNALASAPAGEASEQLRTELLLTLAKMRPTVEPMLIAAIADGSGQFRRDVIELAGYLQLQDAVPWLAAIATGADADTEVVGAAYAALTKIGLSSPTATDARAVILSEIRRLETHRHPPEVDQWWIWDKQQLRAQQVTPTENRLLAITRLSRLLVELPTATSADRRLGLIYAQQVAEQLEQPLSEELQQLADSLDAGQLSEALHEAIERKQISAAIACTTMLGTRGKDTALSAMGGQPSPLAVALAHPHRELRFAALEAVMKIKPQRSFVGSSSVTKALWYFAAGSGDPQVIVGSSTVGKASEWAGQLRGLGYDATPVTTGRQMLLTALNSPRLELMLIDSDIRRPPLREVVYSLRSNPQLSHVPIAVLSSLHNLSRAERIAEADTWLLATPRPHSVESLETVLSELLEIGNNRSTTARRTEQAQSALTWLAELLESGHPYDELLRDADQMNQTLYDAKLTQVSLRVLASLGTAGSQQLLVDVASAPVLPIETRRAAGEAFAKSVKRFGKLLTSAEILRQYDLYNASETADQATQKVLGNLLDVLEKQK